MFPRSVQQWKAAPATSKKETTIVSTENTPGRVAVITGASSGIGEATARALAADGYRVALLARRVDRIKALADELGDGGIAIQADVTDRESIVAASQRCRRASVVSTFWSTTLA